MIVVFFLFPLHLGRRNREIHKDNRVLNSSPASLPVETGILVDFPDFVKS